MKVPKVLQLACRRLRAAVRFKQASLRLPGTPFSGDDTEAIREATALYMEAWVVPLIDAIESGDSNRMQLEASTMAHDPMGSPGWKKCEKGVDE